MKRFDRYGLGLKLLFSGEDQFKTGLGGTVSLLISLVIMAYGTGKILHLYQMDEPVITTTQKHISLKATAPLNLADQHFDFMVHMFYYNKKTGKVPIKIPPSIG